MNIPPEFACFNYYLEAAQQFQSRYPDIADVLNKCFSDSCQDLVDEGKASPEAQQFLNGFNDEHSNPPDEAVQQVRQVADQFYRILLKQYNAGKFSPTLEKQLGLTSILYSVLDGEDADQRCQQCKDLRKSVQDMLLGDIPQTQPNPPNQPNPSSGGPPAFTPPQQQLKQNSSGSFSDFQQTKPQQSSGGPPVFTPPPQNLSSGGPPVFTPPSQNLSNGGGGPPVFTPPGYPSIPTITSPPSFTTTNVPNGNAQTQHFNQTYNNFSQTQQNSINIPSSAADAPPPYGSFPPTASQQIQQKPQQKSFDSKGAISLLNSLGYPIVSSSTYPPLNDSTYPLIQTYLEYAINSLRNNDNVQSLAFLQNAFRVWTTGSQ